MSQKTLALLFCMAVLLLPLNKARAETPLESDGVCPLERSYPHTPLMQAVRQGKRAEDIAGLLNSAKDPQAFSYLTEWQRDGGNYSTSSEARGKGISAQDSRGASALHFAVACNPDPAVTALLLRAGADPSGLVAPLYEPHGTTEPLKESVASLAARHARNVEVLRVLHNAGVSFDAAKGQTPPLEQAVYNRNPAVLKYLLESGANIDRKFRDTDERDLDLHLLRKGLHATEANFTLLLQRAENKVKKSPLVALAIEQRSPYLELLVRAGADVNVTMDSASGDKPVHRASMQTEGASALRLLIKAGADPNSKTRQGDTPLLLAVRAGNAEAVSTLLNAGADPNAAGKDRETPLLVASREHPRMIGALLKAGADPNPQDDYRDGPLYNCVTARDTEGVKLLLLHGAKVPPPGMGAAGPASLSIEAARSGAPKDLVQLLRRHEESGFTQAHQQELLRAALTRYRALPGPGHDKSKLKQIGDLARNDLELARLALEGGASPSRPNAQGHTPLMEAAMHGCSPEVMGLILEKSQEPKALINAFDNRGRTALMHLLMGGYANTEALEFLIKSGADLNARDSNGQTALMLALENPPMDPEWPKWPVIRAALRHNPDLNQADYNGRTLISYVRQAEQYMGSDLFSRPSGKKGNEVF